jgi:hypothetical protein
MSSKERARDKEGVLSAFVEAILALQVLEFLSNSVPREFLPGAGYDRSTPRRK